MSEKLTITVAENLQVEVQPDSNHEFLMTTADVAKGYGVSSSTIRRHKLEHPDEFIEGKHYSPRVSILNARCKSGGYLNKTQTLWTKRGIVRLGFFIKSERAKLFRDWAEDLVIALEHVSKQVENQLSLFPEVKKRKHNRLSTDRLVAILADIAQIDNKELRLSLIEKLTKY